MQRRKIYEKMVGAIYTVYTVHPGNTQENFARAQQQADNLYQI